MKGVIRHGDLTSHGGKVIAGSGTSLVHGVPVARKGDACICPVKGHASCVIAEGDPLVMDGGLPVAFEGHKTSCGATLITSAPSSVKV